MAEAYFCGRFACFSTLVSIPNFSPIGPSYRTSQFSLFSLIFNLMNSTSTPHSPVAGFRQWLLPLTGVLLLTTASANAIAPTTGKTVLAANNFVPRDDSNEVPLNTATPGNVLLNDENPDNLPAAAYTATVVTTPTHGTLALAADGSYTYTPTTGYLGPDSFTYRICQLNGTPACSGTAAVGLNVYDPATACAAASGPNLLANPGFENGNTGFTTGYSFVASPQPSPNGLYAAGAYAVGPNATAYHTAFQGTGRGGTGNFMIVNGAANIPRVYSQTVNVVPNRYYVLSFYANSVNPGSPARLGFTINGKSVSAVTTLGTTPAYQAITDVWFSGASTTATFQIQDINKDAGGNDFGLDDVYFGTCSQSLRVSNVTQSPPVPNTAGAARLLPLVGAVTGGPPSVQVASFTIVTTPTSGTLRLNGPMGPLVAAGRVIPYANRDNLYYTPVSGFVGNSTFTYTATDSQGGPADNTATFTIPVVAFGFVARNDSRDVPRNTATTGSVIPNDDNRDNTANFTATLVASPAHGTVDLDANGGYTYTPTTGYLGADSFTYQICQAGPPAACSNTATVALNVYNPAAVCIATAGANLLVNPGFAGGNTGFTTDYTFVASPQPSPNGLYAEGTYAVGSNANTYHNAFQGTGRGGVGNFMIVNGAADKPEVYRQTVSVLPNRYYSLSVYATSLRPARPAQLAFTINDQSVSEVTTLAGSTAYERLETVWFSGSSTSATLEIRNVNKSANGNKFGLDDLYFGTCSLLVANVTHSPAVPNTAAPTRLLPLAATLTGTTPGGTIASLVIATLPGSGTLRLGGPTGPLVTAGQTIPYPSRDNLYYLPVSPFTGNTTFTYTALDSDGNPSYNTATYTIPVVAAVADVTTSISGPTTVEVGQPTGQFTVNFINNGPDAALDVRRTVTLPVGASMTTVQIAASGGTYNAGTRVLDFGRDPRLGAGLTNSFTFSFTAPSTTGTRSLVSNTGTPTNQGSNTAPDQFTRNIQVANASTNRFVTNDDSNEVPQNTTRAGNVIINDNNPDNTLNYTATVGTSPTHGTLVLSPDGSYTYTPTTGYLGPDNFTYRICQGSPAVCSNTSTVALNVYDAARVCRSATGRNLLDNPGFNQGNADFTSSYDYVASPQASPNGLYPEGTYAVAADSHTFHNSFQGVGRGGSGNFMMVNGSADLSQVYVQTVRVIPNRYYTFSVYASSVFPDSPAELGFAINGKSVSVVTRLTGALNRYQLISDIWYSGTNTTAAFEIRDVNREETGNDFGLDDLYFGTCNANLTVRNVMQRPAIRRNAPATRLLPMEATATGPGVSVASLVIQSLPSAGTLRLGGPTGPLVTVGQVIPYDSRENLYYTSTSAGTTSFTYSAVDNEEAGSNDVATFTIPVDEPLPVTLVNFSATAVNNVDARLVWRTATELRNDRFEVERSFDSQTFSNLATVAGQGTKSTATDYTLTDTGVGQTAAGTVYYRLRQVDSDETATYSPVRMVHFTRSAAETIRCYPNPMTAETTLDLSQLPSGTYHVRLIDMVGRVVMNTQLAPGLHTLDLHELVSGSYVLQVRGDHGGQSVHVSKRVTKN